MQLKSLSLSVFLGLFLIVAMAGCGHDHDGGHSHYNEPVNQQNAKTDKPKSTTHETIE